MDESKCFYFYDDNGQVVCRCCYKSFLTWLNYKMHFNTSCHISVADYKLNTYNEVYKKYKLNSTKNKIKTWDYWSSAQQIDPITINNRRTRNKYEFESFNVSLSYD